MRSDRLAATLDIFYFTALSLNSLCLSFSSLITPALDSYCVEIIRGL